MSNFIVIANNLIWESLLIYLLLGVGIFFTLKTRLIQVRRFSHASKIMLSSRKRDCKTHISPFQTFCTSLAARIGTGNMAGVAVAIYLGGPGAVFWMWIIALLGMATSVGENVLAQLYKTNNHDGTFRGGPAYYIEKALGMRWLGIIFSVSLIIAFGFAFNGVQSNSIAAAFSSYDIPAYWIGISLAFVSSLIIFGGVRSVHKVSEVIVPIMALGYLFVALGVVAINFRELPAVFSLVFRSAFGLESVASGGVGFMVSQAMMQGIKRGLFSNEAGMGSAPNAAAVSHASHPVSQGMIGMLGVFVDTIVVCTSTATIVLLSGVLEPGNGVTGVELTQLALTNEVGSWGKHLVTISIFLFAFTSILANYSYGETNLIFICKSKLLLFAYRVGVLVIVVWGALGDLPLVWAFADLSMGVMALINLVSILILSRLVFLVLKDYDKQLDEGVKPVFNRKQFPFLDKTMDKDVW